MLPLIQLQHEIDNASQLVKSNGEANRIDIDVCTKKAQHLEAIIETAKMSGVATGSPVAVAAKQLISNLNVKARCCMTVKHTKCELNTCLRFVLLFVGGAYTMPCERICFRAYVSTGVLLRNTQMRSYCAPCIFFFVVEKANVWALYPVTASPIIGRAVCSFFSIF